MASRHNFHKYHPPVREWDLALHQYQSARTRVRCGVKLEMPWKEEIGRDEYQTVSVERNKIVLFEKGELPANQESDDGWGTRYVGGRESSVKEISLEELSVLNPEWLENYKAILKRMESEKIVLEEKNKNLLQEEKRLAEKAWGKVEDYFKNLFQNPAERRPGNIDAWNSLRWEAEDIGIIPARLL